MPPISRPPPTCRRVAFTSAQPASTPLSDDPLHPVMSFLFILFVVSSGILIFIFFLRIVIVSLPSKAAHQASPPPSDDTVDYGPVGTSIAFVGVWISFIAIFCLILNAVLYFVIYGLVPRGAPLRAPRGLHPAIIKTFPIVLYSAVKGLTIREAPLECAVCLSRFKDDSRLQLIPKCEHAFHPNCIAKWFASHTTCPVCRTNLASQLVVHSASQLSEASTEPPLGGGGGEGGGFYA